MGDPRGRFFADDQYLQEFVDFLRTVTWSDRSPLNTEISSYGV